MSRRSVSDVALAGGHVPAVAVLAGGRPLAGRLRTPGDKSISHRALLLGALADGVSEVSGLSDGADVARTREAVVALGAAVERQGDGWRVEGGRARLHPADHVLDCGNSGTSLRLLSGLVAGLLGESVLSGDASLSGRPMDRIAEPLALMGATVTGRGERCLPPITIVGRPLHGIEWTTPMASAQVKSCILLAALSASGETVVRERVATRVNTEEMLARAGADVTVVPWGEGCEVRVRPSALSPFTLVVPGDPSQAAFWVVAACLIPGSEVVVEHVYAGAARTGYLIVLQRMGASVSVSPTGPDGAADVSARGAPLEATVVEAAEIPSLDEVPVLAVAAAAAAGTTVFRDVGELRVKETDRLAGAVALLAAFGAEAEAAGDDLIVHGLAPRRLSPGTFDSGGDHRMAMAAVVAALAAGAGESTVTGFGAVATSYPGFLTDLATLTGGDPRPASPAPPPRRRPFIAIDGPAGAGKSTVSSFLAERLGVERLDTGAMYRAVAWAALDRGVEPTDADGVAAIARDAHIDVGETVRVDGVDVTGAIRSSAVSTAVSAVAANPAVRRHLVARQQAWGARRDGAVVEGRDIGTVVFPRADLKIYLTASPEERARRRDDESAEGVANRDRLDSNRVSSPLVQAADAHLLDTTGRSVEDVVSEVMAWL